MNNSATLFDKWYSENEARVIEQMKSFIRIDSTTPNELKALEFVEEYLSELGFAVERLPFHPDLKQHPSFTPYFSRLRELNNHPPERFCLRARYFCQKDDAPTCIVNGHVDVVPPSSDSDLCFEPFLSEDGNLFGRGSCDTKGNIVMFLETCRFLIDSGIGLNRNIVLDIVVEEEIGGNGSLSNVMYDISPDEVIVLEPTDLMVFCGHRGCLGFTIDFEGRAVHMGSDVTGESAIDLAISVIKDLKKFEEQMLAEALADSNFNQWPRPVQVNVGLISGGEWSGSVPQKASITGDVGFLPKYRADDIKNRLKTLIEVSERESVRSKSKLQHLGLRNEAYITDPHSPFVKRFVEVTNHHGVKQDSAYGWKVSCDARLYANVLNVPTIIFGAGSLDVAHASDEHLSIQEMKKGMEILRDYFKNE